MQTEFLQCCWGHIINSVYVSAVNHCFDETAIRRVSCLIYEVSSHFVNGFAGLGEHFGYELWSQTVITQHFASLITNRFGQCFANNLLE